eukprot:GHVR01169273.1.p1 GENE.GHVR01169273.1~~GHVR01169273.1.p1  ORF type:complete len:111 (+),score=11.75 GHVR01169273.1:115-447(+)
MEGLPLERVTVRREDCIESIEEHLIAPYSYSSDLTFFTNTSVGRDTCAPQDEMSNASSRSSEEVPRDPRLTVRPPKVPLPEDSSLVEPSASEARIPQSEDDVSDTPKEYS